MSDSSRPHELQHARPPCPSPAPGVHPNPCPSSWWCHPTISSSVIPFSSCPQSFPASGSFPMSQLFELRGQSIRASASASVLPMNLQGWFPLGWTGRISLLSKGLSRVSSLGKIMHVKSWGRFLAYRESLIFKVLTQHSQIQVCCLSQTVRKVFSLPLTRNKAYFLSHRGAPCNAVGTLHVCSIAQSDSLWPHGL